MRAARRVTLRSRDAASRVSTAQSGIAFLASDRSQSFPPASTAALSPFSDRPVRAAQSTLERVAELEYSTLPAIVEFADSYLHLT